MFPIRDHNPSGRKPIVTWLLLAANIAIFIQSWPLQESDEAVYDILYTWGVIPASLMTGDGLLTPLTSMFLHAGWLHLAGNMLFLWIFGDNMEDAFGHLKYLLFYLMSGLAAVLIQVAADPWAEIPIVGASGAIAGVLGGYLFLFPRARVDILFIFIIFFRIFAVPAWIVLSLWFVVQIFGGLAVVVDEGGVAYWAHAGGFVTGLIWAMLFWLRRRRDAPRRPVATERLSRTGVPRVIRRK